MSDNLKNFLKSLLPILSVLLILTLSVSALDIDIPPELKDDRSLPREERIKRHQKRVQLILEARKNAREEERKRQLEESRQKAEAARSTKKDTARNRPEPSQPDSSPALSIESSSNNVLASTILHFYPFDKTVAVGKNFLTDLQLFNMDSRKIEQLNVKIMFDPRFIVPVMINDNQIHDQLAGDPDYSIDMENGEITYGGVFNEPFSLDNVDILRIAWKTLRQTDYTELTFDLSNDHTQIIANGKDILGTENEKYDGIIPTGIIILDDIKDKKGKIQLDHELMKNLDKRPPLMQPGKITLKLESDTKVVRPGEVFDVSVHISNPEAEIFDKLSMYIRYNPEILKVIDYDKRNWIRKGVNIFDGFARRKFPFDYHLRNEANNYLGTIDYRMGTSRLDPFPSGEIARIRFQAVNAGKKASISFAQTSSRSPDTSITSMGKDLLAPEQWLDDDFQELNITIAE